MVTATNESVRCAGSPVPELRKMADIGQERSQADDCY